MQVFNNSPQAGYIRWQDVKISYKGQVYNIANGSTDFIYVYWKYSDPRSFYGSDVFPTLGADDLMVFLNKNGVHVKVPTATVLDGSLIVPESILTDALSANVVTSDKIASNAITTDKLSANAVGANIIASGAVLADHIKAGQIKTTHIASEGLDVSKITGAINQTTFNALETRVTSAEGKFASYVTLTKYNSDINGATNGVIARLTKAESAIDQTEADILLRVTKTELDTRMGDVVDRLDSAESQLSINTTAISQRVTTTTFNALSGRVSTAEGRITTMAGQIDLKASQSDLNAIDGRLNTAESTLSVLPGQINSKVEKNGVISTINQSAESIKINVAQLALNGDLVVTNGLARLRNAVIDSVHIKDNAIVQRMFADNVIVNEINAGTAKVDFAKISNVQITNAMIQSLDASKLTANSIIANNITFKGKLDGADGTFRGQLTSDNVTLVGGGFNAPTLRMKMDTVNGVDSYFSMSTSNTQASGSTLTLHHEKADNYWDRFTSIEIHAMGLNMIGSNTNVTADMLNASTHVKLGAYTHLKPSDGNSLKIESNTGFIDIGSKNASFAHIYTDRPSFYMNKELLINGRAVFHAGMTELPNQNRVALSLKGEYGWKNYGGDYLNACYWKDKNGVVHLTGLINGGTPSGNGSGVIAQLPVGYRPALREIYSVFNGNGYVARLDVLPTGMIWCMSGRADLVSLAGISFKAEN